MYVQLNSSEDNTSMGNNKLTNLQCLKCRVNPGFYTKAVVEILQD